MFKFNKVAISPGILKNINGRLFIINKGKFFLGKNCKINSSLISNPIGGDTHSTFIIKKNGKLNIGSGTGISNSTIVCAEAITLGENIFIGNNCKIYDTDFHPLDPVDRISGNNTNIKTKPIYIGSNAFIGAHSIILKGANIGKNSIIGAGSVVTKTIPENQIWAGNPIRFIKSLVIKKHSDIDNQI